MRSIAAIAFNTFKEAVRNRVLYVILFFSLLMIGASGAISQLSITEHGRIIKNLGFASINLFGVAIAIFVGVSLVYNELEKRTIYTIVSKPISRWQFLLGKYFGLLLTVYVNLFVMSWFFLFMLHYRIYQGDAGFFSVVASSAGKAFASMIYWGAGAEGSTFAGTAQVMPVIVNTFIELTMVTALAILFSSFTTPTLSMFFTILTFVAGRLNHDIVMFYENLRTQALETSAALPAIYYVAWWAARIIPNLGVFRDSVEQAIYGETIVIWWQTLAYAATYTSALLLLAIGIFNRRNFK